MKIEPPALHSRWYKFMDPANKARIVEVTDFISNHGLVEINREIDGLMHWDLKDFVTEFRPL